MGRHFAAFKAYDVRGIVPSEINADLAYAIGRAYADHTGAKQACVGYDIRLSGPELCEALCKGLNDAGVDAIRLGLVGTEMVYFATGFYGFDGGVMITASHNPPEYNGMKFVREESRPISGDTGLFDIESRAFEKKWDRTGAGKTIDKGVYGDFVKHLLSFVDVGKSRPLHVLLDAGNGAAGVALEPLLPHLSLRAEKMNFLPDGRFPNGVPNPILPEARKQIEARLREGVRELVSTSKTGISNPKSKIEKPKSFDFGVAWDGDYDRCFFFDGAGNFIEGYYIVGLLAHAFLNERPGETIVYDPRLYWNTLEIVERFGGKAVVCKSGHAFIKEKMREVNAIYGGEMSAHHYFRENWYCDSGMIPFLLVSELVSKTGRSLGDLVGEMIEKFPCSGEINFTVADVQAVLSKVEQKYKTGLISHIDGVSVEFPDWRFNLRGSNTEPVIRLNVETRGNRKLLEEKTQELIALIRA
jgi:phosphomannomutase